MTAENWKHYFESNAKSLLSIPWEIGADLSVEEAAAIRTSLSTFQVGESSEGHQLYRYARDYATRTGDTAYVEALKLFIAEEQRHARDLGRFLVLNGIPLVKTTFTDTLFRKLRHFLAGLEVSIRVLVTAEFIAMVYYAALREATQSVILRRLCDQILQDEIMHLRFQCGQLRVLSKNRPALGMFLTMGMQRFLFLGAVAVVGIFHRSTLRRGGYDFRRWWSSCWE